MTDTERSKAPTDVVQHDGPTETDETTQQSDPGQTFQELTDATAEESDEIESFFDSPFAIPGAPESSLDGNWLAYLQPNSDGDLRLWIAPTDGGDPRTIETPFTPVEDRDPESGRILRGPQWSPDGSRIAVTGIHPDGDRTTVWIVPVGAADAGASADAAAEEPAVVAADEPIIETADEIVASAAAPDVAATSKQGDYLVGTDDEEHDDIEVDPLATISPDDAYVVGADDEEQHNGDASEAVAEEASAAATVEEAPAPLAPTGPYVLVNHDGADRSPRWSPDGEIIALTSTIDGRDVIALTTTDGGDAAAIELLTWSRSNDREPAWSRDGKFLAFLRQRPEENEFHDIYCFSLENGELLNLTSEKAPAIRHSLEWVPGRNLIAYVTRENEWLSISVINADNKAGWTVTRESGDKTEPRFAQDEARMVYVRTEGFTTVICERSLHASSAIALDPGEGVARYPRWLNAKRVAYGFSAPQRPFGFMVQENTAKSDRMAIPPGRAAVRRRADSSPAAAFRVRGWPGGDVLRHALPNAGRLR